MDVLQAAEQIDGGWVVHIDARTQKRFLADMVQRLFDGSPSQMVLHALGNNLGASREELKEIRALLNKIESEGG